jgi:hypothetical protein
MFSQSNHQKKYRKILSSFFVKPSTLQHNTSNLNSFANKPTLVFNKSNNFVHKQSIKIKPQILDNQDPMFSQIKPLIPYN